MLTDYYTCMRNADSQCCCFRSVSIIQTGDPTEMQITWVSGDVSGRNQSVWVSGWASMHTNMFTHHALHFTYSFFR